MDKILIGRGAPCDIRLPSALVSYHHATVEMVETNYFITDKASKNGTYLNDKELLRGKRYRLSSGDVIKICGFEILVNLSVPIAETYSAEKTDMLAREMFLCGKGEDDENIYLLEIISGNDAGKIIEIPPSKRTITIGTFKNCDLTISEKRVKDIRIEIELTPSGWKINENSIPQKRNLITFPPRLKLHDEDEIIIGKTKIRFHDPIDQFLSDLKTKKDAEIPQPQPSPGLMKEKVSVKSRLSPGLDKTPKKVEISPRLGQEKASEIKEKYVAEYRIATIAFGIIAFLISLLLLILLLF